MKIPWENLHGQREREGGRGGDEDSIPAKVKRIV